MDSELLKPFFPVLGGILALAGGIFTFVSGRLRDADGVEAKSVVVQRTWQWLTVSLSLGALCISIFTRLYILGIILFTIVFALQAYMFLNNTAPLRRVDVLTFGLLSATFVSSIVFAATLTLMSGIVDIQAKMLGVPLSSNPGSTTSTKK